MGLGTRLVRENDMNPMMYTMRFSRDVHPLFHLARQFLLEDPSARIHPKKRKISESHDLTFEDGAHANYCEKSIDPKKVAEMLPRPILENLVIDGADISFNDGRGSEYDAVNDRMKLKGTADFYHEVGHRIWNQNIIPVGEEEQKDAVNHSVEGGGARRQIITTRMLPSTHKEYAKLVGAQTPQLVRKDVRNGVKWNDLEEVFAENFNAMVQGRRMWVFNPKTTLEDMLGFFRKCGIIDRKFESMYRFIMSGYPKRHRVKHIKHPYEFGCGGDGGPIDACSGEVTNRVIANRHVLEAAMEGVPNVVQEVAIRCDITPEFANYCLRHKPEAVKAEIELLGTYADKGKHCLYTQF
jgi:hypothetical protein